MATRVNRADPEIFIQVLHDCGALKILVPEIDRLFGTPDLKKPIRKLTLGYIPYWY